MKKTLFYTTGMFGVFAILVLHFMLESGLIFDKHFITQDDIKMDIVRRINYNQPVMIDKIKMEDVHETHQGMLVFFSFETSRFQETYYGFVVYRNDRKMKPQHEIALLSNNYEKAMGSYLNSIDEQNKEAALIASYKKTTGVISAR